MEAVDIHKDKKKKSFSPTRRIAFSFFMVILIGSILLCFSFSNNGTVIPYLDHLFIATSATCVTGLVFFDWSIDYISTYTNWWSWLFNFTKYDVSCI